MLWLDDLSNKIGSRLSGSVRESGSIYKSTIRDPLDRVYLQEVMVPVRGEKETAYIQDNKTKITVPICAWEDPLQRLKLDLPPK
jgi:IS4 transposase